MMHESWSPALLADILQTITKLEKSNKLGPISESSALVNESRTSGLESDEQQAAAQPGKMAAATCTRDIEKNDLEAKLDELFARFWRRIIIRELQAKAHKVATTVPVNPQHERTPPPVIKACKLRRGRQNRGSRKPKSLLLLMAATHPHQHQAKRDLPGKQLRHTVSIQDWSRPRDPRQTAPQLLSQHQQAAYPRPGRSWRRHHCRQYTASHGLTHASRSAPWGSDLAVMKTSCIVRIGWIHHSRVAEQLEPSARPPSGIG
ncbi:Hypothetical predicted protein [Pelobates cultripes]|uniref:Uncharacterized protein n=1 Tax=Pelobates cultripes TaxID=61616 RepID=A0AAD1S0H6_PELCU|nr:Hypothetical predicted protein [Pelobates cultripes]